MPGSPFVVLDRGDVGRNVKALPLSGITSDMLFGGTQPDTLASQPVRGGHEQCGRPPEWFAHITRL